jgi:hypothetical protein
MRRRSGRNSQASMLRALTCAREKQQQQIELRGMKMININTSEEKVSLELSDNNNLIRNIQCCGFFGEEIYAEVGGELENRFESKQKEC